MVMPAGPGADESDGMISVALHVSGVRGPSYRVMPQALTTSVPVILYQSNPKISRALCKRVGRRQDKTRMAAVVWKSPKYDGPAIQIVFADAWLHEPLL